MYSMKKSLFVFAALAAMIVGFSSCGEVTIDDMQLEQMYYVTVDSTILIEPMITPEGKNAKVNWTSRDTAIAVVKDGYVTGVSRGKTLITANVGNTIASCEVTVYNPIADLQIAPTSIGDDSIVIKVTPHFPEGYYYVGYGLKANIDQYSDSILSLSALQSAQNMLTQYQQQYPDLTLDQLLKAYGLYGENQLLARSLKANTAYTLYGVGIDPVDMRVNQKIARIDVTTKEVQKSNMTIDIDFKDSILTITPSSLTEKYIMIIASKAMMDTTYKEDYAKLVQDQQEYYASIPAAYQQFYGTFESRYVMSGVKTNNYATSKTFKSGDYVVITAGYRAQTINTKFFTKVFTYKSKWDEDQTDNQGGDDTPDAEAALTSVKKAPKNQLQPLDVIHWCIE